MRIGADIAAVRPSRPAGQNLPTVNSARWTSSELGLFWGLVLPTPLVQSDGNDLREVVSSFAKKRERGGWTDDALHHCPAGLVAIADTV